MMRNTERWKKSANLFGVMFIAACGLTIAGCRELNGNGNTEETSSVNDVIVSENNETVSGGTAASGSANSDGTAASEGAAISDGSGTSATDNTSDSEGMEPVSPEEIETPTDASDHISVPVLENLGVNSALLTEQFYHSGMDASLNFCADGVTEETETLSCSFTVMSEELFAHEWTEELPDYGLDVAWATFLTEEQKHSYIVTPELGAEAEGLLSVDDWQISFIENGEFFFVRVSGAGALDGDYFALDDMVSEPDVFERYMNRADFYEYSAEELRLLRNEIYAVHGAIFKSEDLQTYFGEKIWYEGTIATEEFSEELLSEVEIANLALIREMENADNFWDEWAAQQEEDGGQTGESLKAAYEARSDAPYLAELDQFEETGVYVDMRLAVDKEFYYSVPGEVRVPVTLTYAQIQALENGEEVELGECDPTDAVMMLRKDSAGTPGVYNYWFYEKGSEPGENCMDASAALDVESGLYKIWILSDDTVMKTAYAGEIYILKGATRGDYVSLLAASQDQRELKIPESDGDIWNKEVWSNRIRHDGKGYISAVYYLGD